MVFQQLSMLFTLSMLQQSSKALTPEITFQGTKIRNGSSHVYQFTCATNVRFWGCTVELFVKNETNVKLRLFEKTCYNRYSICKPEICSCSDGCNEFKWNLTNQVNMDNASIECEGRLQQYDLFFKANAHIMVYRTGFINLGSTVDLINSDFTSVITSSTSSPYLEKESSDNKAILIAILCFVSLIPIVLILLILRCILQHFYESEGGSNDQLTLFCCPLSHNRSTAINRSAKTRGNVIELDTNITPNNRKHTIYRHRVDTLKTNPKKRGQTTQSQIRSVNTSEIITKPNEHDKIKTMMRPQSSYINETELNINSNDLGQAIQQQIDVKEDQIKLQRSASDVHKQNVFGANGTFCMNAESKERNAKEVKVNLERSASDATHKNVFGANGPLCMNAESIDRKRSKNKIKLTPPVRFGNIGNQSKDISRCSISSDSTDGNTSMENLIRTGTGC